MSRIILIVPLCLVFWLGCFSRRGSCATSGTDKIREAVFHYQLRENDITVDATDNQRHRDFLAILIHGIPFHSPLGFASPHQALVLRLKRRYRYVRSYFQFSWYARKWGLYGKPENAWGDVYFVSKLHQLNKSVVDVRGGTIIGFGGESDYGGMEYDIYHVVKHGSHWIVTGYKNIFATG